MRGRRDWASLEKGLLRDVFLRLPADVDAAHFRRVCHGWRVAAGDGAPVPRPWFVLQPCDDDFPVGHAVLRPAARRRRGRRTHVMHVPVDAAAAACARGASRGWLAVNEGKRLFLRDPITRAEVPLPAVDAGYHLFDVFLSDDPLAAPDGRWMAFAFLRRDGIANPWDIPAYVLAFCRPGDAEWARFDHDDAGQQARHYRGLEFFRGRAYVLISNPGRLAFCDVEARRLVVTSVPVPFPPAGAWNSQECLVECGGDLLVVQVWRRVEMRVSYCIGGRYIDRNRVWFFAKAFRIEFDAGGSGKPVAVSDVAGTGDYSLFVAPQGHAFALPASRFPSVRPGCVYFFTIDSTSMTRSVKGMVVIDLKADCARRHKFVRKLPLPGKWRIVSWLCPRSPVLDAATPARRRC